MDLVRLINHPELMSKETLYELRNIVALYPYYQTARILMLKNMYLLHDSAFDDELRRTALYVTDRSMLFQLVESAHYEFKNPSDEATNKIETSNDDRTISIIDNFLDSAPEQEQEPQNEPKRKPTPADAAVDYVAYLLKTESEEDDTSEQSPQLKGQELIDDFINKDGGKIQLQDQPTYKPELEEEKKDENESEEGYFTETLAKIYIKQGRYSKALEIIQRLNLNYPKKNAYFADQIRFLKKLIINNKNNKYKNDLHIIRNFHRDSIFAHDWHCAYSGVKGWRFGIQLLII